jgi:protein-disulfide isomerase
MVRSPKLKPEVNEQDHVQGDKSAIITLVEYGDYQCPYCGAAYPLVKRLQHHFGDDLRFVFRNFPLANSHPHALIAALAAEAASLQGKFWPMHDMLYENQNRLAAENILSYATALGLNLTKFDQDMRGETLLNRIRADLLSGEESDVQGTPTFYVNGMRYDDSTQYPEMIAFLENLRGGSGMTLTL